MSIHCLFDYLYICTRILNLFTYFTNSSFLSYLHNYAPTHISHYFFPTLSRSVCLLRWCEKMLHYIHLKYSYLLHSAHKYKKPLALWTQSLRCVFTYMTIKNPFHRSKIFRMILQFHSLRCWYHWIELVLYEGITCTTYSKKLRNSFLHPKRDLE